MLRSLSMASLCLTSSAAFASLNPIPQESGFSGALGLGVSYSSIASNLYKGDADTSIAGIGGSPSSHSQTDAFPVLDLRYTFANSGTQFVLGNQVQDMLRMDYTQLLGVRQQVGNYGIVTLAGTFGGWNATNTWTDPYSTQGNRSGTNRKSTGVLLGWENILGSAWNMDFNQRKIKLSSEESGQSIPALSANQRALLDRNGDNTRVRIGYEWMLTQGQYLVPSMIWSQDNLNGEAMSSKALGVKLDYVVRTGLNTITTNMYMGQTKYNQGNPLFNNQKADSRDYLLGLNYVRGELLGYKSLSGFINAAYGKSNSDIDFYSITVKSVSTGVAYHF